MSNNLFCLFIYFIYLFIISYFIFHFCKKILKCCDFEGLISENHKKLLEFFFFLIYLNWCRSKIYQILGGVFFFFCKINKLNKVLLKGFRYWVNFNFGTLTNYFKSFFIVFSNYLPWLSLFIKTLSIDRKQQLILNFI